MNLQALTRPAAPWLHVLPATPAEAWDAVQALEHATPGRVAARLLRGRKAATTAAFFDECAAALQFPPYFGENWDACNDCLGDLAWLRADAVVLGVTDAVHFLAAAPAEQLRLFMTVVNELLPSWNQAKKAATAKSFHLVLQATPGEEAVLHKRWEAAGATLHRLPAG